MRGDSRSHEWIKRIVESRNRLIDLKTDKIEDLAERTLEIARIMKLRDREVLKELKDVKSE